MGYICIALALLAGTTKGYMGKRISRTVSTFRQSAFVNMVRMAVCVLISAAVFAVESIGRGAVLDTAALLCGAAAGVFLSVFMISWLLAVRQGAYMLVSVAQMFGVIVTLALSFVVFRTPVSPKQAAAVGLLFVSVFVMGSYSKSLNGKLGAAAVVTVAVCGLSSGLYDFSLKLFVSFSAASVSALNLLSFSISAVALTGLFFVTRGRETIDGKGLFRSTFAAVLCLSVCLFVNAYFKTLANRYLSPVQVYPIYQAGGLILSAVMSALLFGEKITRRCLVGLAAALGAILLLA